MAHRPNKTPAAEMAADILTIVREQGDDHSVTDDEVIERGWSRADLLAHGPEARQIARRRLNSSAARQSPRFGQAAQAAPAGAA
ncbi:hypothetical protein [Elstera sp.]|jgi:hypothetical protein|uniref:hypothetical protein n=1 Tax=Elstera sp. TaxID=1916664 RepID=UPI0037C0CBCF